MIDSKKELEEEKEVEDSLAFRINDLENYYADNVLSDDLKEIYAEVQKDCEEFRANVFFKNLEILEDTLGRFNTKNENWNSKQISEKDREYEEMLRDIKSPDELMKEFSEKAEQYKEA